MSLEQPRPGEQPEQPGQSFDAAGLPTGSVGSRGEQNFMQGVQNTLHETQGAGQPVSGNANVESTTSAAEVPFTSAMGDNESLEALMARGLTEKEAERLLDFSNKFMGPQLRRLRNYKGAVDYGLYNEGFEK